MNDNLAMAMLIVERCRREGDEAKRAGTAAADCPYGDDRELERAGWLDGFTRAPRVSEGQVDE